MMAYAIYKCDGKEKHAVIYGLTEKLVFFNAKRFIKELKKDYKEVTLENTLVIGKKFCRYGVVEYCCDD